MSSVATSMAALKSVDTNHLETEVLKVIAGYGVRGCISDEVRSHFPTLAYSSVTARYTTLEKKKLMHRSGTRKGESGRPQSVMFAASVVPLVSAAA